MMATRQRPRRLEEGESVDPYIGEVLRALRRDPFYPSWFHQCYIDVLQRSLDGNHFLAKTAGHCRTSAWFSPEAVKLKEDPVFAALAAVPAAPEQRQFRVAEGDRLRRAFSRGSFEGLRQTHSVPDFVTAPSKYMVKVTEVPEKTTATLRPRAALQSADLSFVRGLVGATVCDGEIVEIDQQCLYFRVEFAIPQDPDDGGGFVTHVGYCYVRDAGNMRRDLIDERLHVGDRVRVRILSEVEGTIYLTTTLTDLRGIEMERLLERCFRSGRPAVRELKATVIDWSNPPASARTAVFGHIAKSMEPPDLIEYRKYQCWASFVCPNEDCRNDWKSILAWGVCFRQGDVQACVCDITRKRLVGCLHTFKSVADCRRGHGAESDRWFPEPNARSVFQRCRVCESHGNAQTVEVFYNQEGSGSHLPEHCPECCLRGEWCSNQGDPPTVVDEYTRLLHCLSPGLKWEESDIGLECEFVETSREGRRRWLIQLVPEVFIVPKHLCYGPSNEMRNTPTGQEHEILRGDRLPAGVDQETALRAAFNQAGDEAGVGAVGEHGRLHLDTEGLSEEDLAILDFQHQGSSMSGKLQRAPRFFSFRPAAAYPNDRRRGDGRGLFGNYGERHGVT